MKKTASIFMSIMLALGLAACGNSAPAASVAEPTPIAVPESEVAETATETPKPESEATAEEADSHKVLVVYYSGSGHTAQVAENIAKATNADLFEITPSEPYTAEDLDYTNSDSRVVREHDDESLRDVELVTTDVENWDSYDTVFIGYPIWWQIAAWPVNNFVKDNDFTGKTVIPFATSASSGMGESGTLLAEIAGSGDWQEGHRFASSASTDEVAAWVSELGL